MCKDRNKSNESCKSCESCESGKHELNDNCVKSVLTKLDLDNFQPFMSAVLLEGLTTKSD